jgi:hypothetical protein
VQVLLFRKSYQKRPSKKEAIVQSAKIVENASLTTANLQKW